MQSRFTLTILLLLAGTLAKSQPTSGNTGKDPLYVQFSGIVLTHDSLKAVPYAFISITGTNKSTMADKDGFFNFVARAGDSIQFRSLGYKPMYTVIPKDLNTTKYSWIQLMRDDTVFLNEAVIRPWPSKAEIDYYLATGNSEEYAQALANNDPEKLARLQQSLAMNGSENQRLVLNKQASIFYYTGQAPPLRVLDPLAWASFFKTWKSGGFKQK